MPGTITPSKSTLQAYLLILFRPKEVSKIKRDFIKKRNLPMDGCLLVFSPTGFVANLLHYETLKFTKNIKYCQVYF
jgi:hypothetical protein